MVKEFIYSVLLVTLLGVGSILLLSTNQKIISSPAQVTGKLEYSNNFYRGIEINIPSRKLFLVEGNIILREYKISVGKSADFMTPLGNYQVSSMKKNNLATESQFIEDINSKSGKFISFLEKDNGIEYSIQETSQINNIGSFSSLGNIQMLKEDLDELFELVDVGTPIKVKYERFHINKNKNVLSINVFPDPYNLSELSYREIEDKIFTDYPTVILDDAKLQKLIEQPVQKDLIAQVGKFNSEQIT